jgi:hypothetical protein
MSLVVLSVSLLVTSVPAGPTAHATLPRTSSSIHRWEPEYMATSHDYTRRQALRHARRFDVIVALRDSFSRYVGAMRAENPNLTLLVYANGGYSMHDDGSKYAGALYARDRDGNKIRSRDFGNYLMDVSSADWRNHLADLCTRLRADSGYDGCFLDSLGPAALEPAYVTGVPVNPATGNVWTRSDWLAATHGLASVVKTALGTRPLVINGVQHGMAYFDPQGTTGILADGIEGGMVELFIRPPFISVRKHRSLRQWRDDVNMLVDAGADGRALLCVTKVWTSGTARQMRRWHRFALASFMMGTNGRSYFSYLDSKVTGGRDDVWVNDLGAPSGAYVVRSSGVYQRFFASGRALVNPTAESIRVRLGERLLTPRGDLVSRLTLRPYDGAVLTSP